MDGKYIGLGIAFGAAVDNAAMGVAPGLPLGAAKVRREG